jgi:hypothetical protein
MRRKTNSSKVRQLFPAWASYLPEMPEPQVYEFSKHIADLCATRETDVFKLAAKLRMDPMELLQMINGRSENVEPGLSASGWRLQRLAPCALTRGDSSRASADCQEWLPGYEIAHTCGIELALMDRT